MLLYLPLSSLTREADSNWITKRSIFGLLLNWQMKKELYMQWCTGLIAIMCCKCQYRYDIRDGTDRALNECSSVFADAFMNRACLLLPSHARSILWHSSNDNDQDDWRDFHARLVEQEGQSQPNSNDNILEFLSSSKWAYETSFIEKSSHQQPPFGGWLLRHTFWHKTVMLILKNDNESETLGVFLNMPTDPVIRVDEFVWQAWYGGPVNTGRNIAHLLDTSTLICLHSLLVPDVYKTTFENSKKLFLMDLRL